MATMMIKYGEWRNKKTGNMYVVYDESFNATNAQNGQLMIHYKSQENGEQYVREHSEFIEKFETHVPAIH